MQHWRSILRVDTAQTRNIEVSDEWHLLLGNAFRHLAPDLGAGPGQPVVVVPPPLLQPWLVAVRAAPDPVRGDRVEYMAVQPHPVRGAGRPEREQRLEGRQGLHGA